MHESKCHRFSAAYCPRLPQCGHSHTDLKFGLFSFLDALIFAFLAWSLDAEYDDEACPDFAALERRCFSCTRSSGVMFCRLPTRVDSDAALAVGVFMAMVNEARSSGVIEAIRVLFAAMRFNTESSVFSREARPSAIAAMRRRSFSAASRRFRLGFFCFAPRSASSGRTALPSKRFSHFSDFTAPIRLKTRCSQSIADSRSANVRRISTTSGSPNFSRNSLTFLLDV